MEQHSQHLASTRIQSFTGGLFSEVTKADVGENASKLMSEGCDLLAWADPYFPDSSTPESVQTALIDSAKAGFCAHYTMPIGDKQLRQQLATHLSPEFNRQINSSRNIIITPGSDAGLFYAMTAIINPGDEVIVTDPCYPSNISNLSLLQAHPVFLPLDADNNFQITYKALESVATSRTRAIVLTNPNNPTTTFLRKQSLEDLAKFAEEKDIAVICDEAFCDHIYSSERFIPTASLDALWERTLTVRSFSKGYGLSGIRVGYIIGPDTLMDKLYGAAVNVLGATASASQSAALAALNDPKILTDFFADFSQRATMVEAVLSQVPGLHITPIESGFLSWIDVSAFGTGDEVAQYLVREAQVIVNSGAPYGPSGSHHIRIVQGVFRDPSRMRDALERIKIALLKWPKSSASHQ